MSQATAKFNPARTAKAEAGRPMAVGFGDLFGKWCCVITKILRPKFNGNRWNGGGGKTCNNRATIKAKDRYYCTYHAHKLGILPNDQAHARRDNEQDKHES